MSYLQLRGVSKSFPRAGGGELQVLRDIDLEVGAGQFACVVGRSGAGKTTLVSLIAGLVEADRGEILLAGKPIQGPGPERGIVFQNYSLLPWMTVFENVYLSVDAVAPALSEKEKRERTGRYVELVNLKNAAGKRPRELSGGMRQRVAVARGLAMEPKVLLLDEPFSALDALTRATLQEELARIWMETKKTVVMITNDIDEAILLADYIYPITSGPLASGPGATLGAAIEVAAPRPRLRKQFSGGSEYHRLRKEMLRLLVNGRNGVKSASHFTEEEKYS
ncbi:MAG TPA: ABC transporter ATP-binding protein [Candidatus Binatia bacterium]|jgi:nitrate/nitrite transport system ATP-binding protein